MMRKIFLYAAVMSLGFLLYSCSPGTVLQATGSTKINESTAGMTVDSVTVTSSSDKWIGDPQIENFVTPVLVTIENHSSRPVKISYEDMALTSPNGKRYSALPPFQIRGTVSQPVLAYGASPIIAPEFSYDEFMVAPYYAQIYPEIEPYGGDYFFDPLYYNNYYSNWALLESDLPTQNMIVNALPEGVLNKDGRISGFVYFQKVSASDVNKVNFLVNLINPKNGNMFGTIDIPFKVEKK